MSNITILDQPFEGELQTPFAFKLDDFQKHSYKLINDDTTKNILCCAHTGSGKSMLIEFCILRAKKINKKIFYCSPIKTLSNQKFYEFTQKYPDISIGLITGDHKCNPDADCLIMTTEILCNLLIYKTLKYDDFEINNIDFNDFFAVVFDEVHYINDVERGGVWEKCIMNMPKHINQVMLSATIDKPENFINWVYSCNNNPSYLLTNEKRVVPLHFNYSYWVNNSKLSKELEKYASKINTFTEFTSTSTKVKEIDRMHCLTMDSLNKYFVDVKVNFTFIINEICKQLQVKHMTPAIFFIFSKRKCMEIAKSISTNFNDYNEGVEVGRLFDYYLSKLEQKEAYKNSQQYNVIRDLAIKGISVHHAGLIPVFKEIIEMLFSKNLIKVLFATETFAVGLNMPTKTVIFTDIYKFDNKGKRRLHTHEFIQMSGRAGRRGIDTTGYVIVVPQLFSEITPAPELNKLIFGGSQKISSKFNIDHDYVLELIENNQLDNIENNICKSLLSTEIQNEITNIEQEIVKLTEKVNNFKFDNLELFQEYDTLNNQLNGIIKPSNNIMRKILQKLKEMKVDLSFMKEIDKYNEYMDYKKKLDDALQYKEYTINYVQTNIQNQIVLLEKANFIENNTLTQKGLIARKIKEIDSLVTTNILVSDFVEGLFLNKKIHKIIALFTLLCDGKDDDYIEISEEHYDILTFLRNRDILINRELMEPVLDWYEGKNSREISSMYGIHEGDLVKTLNKLVHIFDDVSQIFLMINKVEYIEIITNIKNKLNRDIVVIESLYLKIA